MNKNIALKEQPKALQKDEEEVKEVYTFMAFNATKKIIDYLREQYVFRHNMGNQKIEFHQKDETVFKDMTDTDFNSIKVELNLNDISCSRDTLRTIIFSNQWEQYDPYKEFLASLPLWDGDDHIAKLASTVRTDDEKYWLWCLRKWLVAFVGSLDEDEIINHTAIILCGKQGIGKSSWLRNILPPVLRKYYSSGFINPKDKESLVQLSELCIFNMDEVENLKPRHIEALKELMTKPSMYLRRAYATLSQNYPRRCSFCGTANGIKILHDITGNRRFLCHNVLGIDYQLNGIDLFQVYAQAYQLFRTGFQFWLNSEEQAAIEKQNARFRAESLEEELVNTYFEPCQTEEDGHKRMQASEIQSFLQRKVPYVKLSSVVIGKILSSKGFISKKSKGISKWILKERDLTDISE